MKKWFQQQKYVLIGFGVMSIILFITTAIQINIITQPEVLDQLSIYIETNEISPSLKKYVFVTLINLLVFAIWTILFMYIMWKVFFPTRKSIREAFLLDSFEFLYKMPSNIKKELKRDE